MMITGDAEGTAVAIARRAGILDSSSSSTSSSSGNRILSGAEIENILQSGSDNLAAVIEGVAVCYRTSPRHKLHIVRALQARGHIVAMTGDGVNDAVIGLWGAILSTLVSYYAC